MEQSNALIIKADGREWKLVFGNLPMGEKRACKIETGLSLEKHLADIDDVTVCALWWLARRANGEPALPYLIAEREFADLKSIEIAQENIEGDDPEA